uniref:Ovule protein n=1 Tax=Strongyloides papillosus TaxID=174720 RepID=A0A0N5B4M5_STREA
MIVAKLNVYFCSSLEKSFDSSPNTTKTTSTSELSDIVNPVATDPAVRRLLFLLHIHFFSRLTFSADFLTT